MADVMGVFNVVVDFSLLSVFGRQLCDLPLTAGEECGEVVYAYSHLVVTFFHPSNQLYVLDCHIVVLDRHSQLLVALFNIFEV